MRPQKCQLITKSFANLFFFGAMIEKKKDFEGGKGRGVFFSYELFLSLTKVGFLTPYQLLTAGRMKKKTQQQQQQQQKHQLTPSHIQVLCLTLGYGIWRGGSFFLSLKRVTVVDNRVIRGQKDKCLSYPFPHLESRVGWHWSFTWRVLPSCHGKRCLTS